MTLSESTLSVPFDTGKAVPEHPSGGGPRVWLDSSCCLVWGECKPDVCSVSSVGARSPALLYFWLPRDSVTSSTGIRSFVRAWEPWPTHPSLGLCDGLIGFAQSLAEGG